MKFDEDALSPKNPMMRLGIRIRLLDERLLIEHYLCCPLVVRRNRE
jgi:hypothetical protein